MKESYSFFVVIMAVVFAVLTLSGCDTLFGSSDGGGSGGSSNDENKAEASALEIEVSRLGKTYSPNEGGTVQDGSAVERTREGEVTAQYRVLVRNTGDAPFGGEQRGVNVRLEEISTSDRVSYNLYGIVSGSQSIPSESFNPIPGSSSLDFTVALELRSRTDLTLISPGTKSTKLSIVDRSDSSNSFDFTLETRVTSSEDGALQGNIDMGNVSSLTDGYARLYATGPTTMVGIGDSRTEQTTFAAHFRNTGDNPRSTYAFANGSHYRILAAKDSNDDDNFSPGDKAMWKDVSIAGDTIVDLPVASKGSAAVKKEIKIDDQTNLNGIEGNDGFHCAWLLPDTSLDQYVYVSSGTFPGSGTTTTDSHVGGALPLGTYDVYCLAQGDAQTVYLGALPNTDPDWNLDPDDYVYRKNDVQVTDNSVLVLTGTDFNQYQ